MPPSTLRQIGIETAVYERVRNKPVGAAITVWQRG
jgi:hypothetical protein